GGDVLPGLRESGRVFWEQSLPVGAHLDVLVALAVVGWSFGHDDTPDSSDDCASSARYRGSAASRSACGPTMAIRPSTSIATRSARSTVEGRWATTSAVVV